MRIEFMNGTTDKEIEQRVKVVATAGQISHSDLSLEELYKERGMYKDGVSAFDNNIKAIQRIISSGHTSIIEHDTFTIFLTGVSAIIEQILIGQRLASFTIKSRRYVDFRNSGYCMPDLDDSVQKKMKEHFNYLFDTYSDLVEKGVPKEDARFVLPYCFYSDIVMTLNARSLEKLIDYCINGKMSQIDEVREFGLKLSEITKHNVPYLEKSLEKIENSNQRISNDLSFLDGYVDNSLIGKPRLISVSSDYTNFPLSKIDRTIIVSFIQTRKNISFFEANSVYDKLSEDEKAMCMAVICNSKEQRELEQVSFKFEFSTTLSTLTHLTRHRMQSLMIPDFLPIWDLSNYIIPDSIVRNNCLDIYKEAFSKNINLYNELKSLGVPPKDLVYFYMSGNMGNFSTNINGRELMWMSRLRCCNRAQWEVRDIVSAMCNLVGGECELFKNYLGASCAVFGKCPEGKHSCGEPQKRLVR